MAMPFLFQFFGQGCEEELQYLKVIMDTMTQFELHHLIYHYALNFFWHTLMFSIISEDLCILEETFI